MERESLLNHWDEAWTSGLWYAPWSRVLEGLTAKQAAWSPAAGRHSIWQIVNHMIFWREYEVRALVDDTLSAEERSRRNFESPAAIDEEAWAAAKATFARSQQQMRDAIANEKNSIERLQYLIFHDSYHVGQITFLRSMQGLGPIE